MTRSACLAAASALALATVLNIGIADAQNVGETGQRALRNAPVLPVIGQGGALRIQLLSAVQDISLGEASAAKGSSASQLVPGGQKLAKVEVEGEVKATKLDAGPASEQKPAVETKPNDAPAVVEKLTKNVDVQPVAEAKADRPAEPARAAAEQQPTAEAKVEVKVEQQAAAPVKAIEAQAQPAPVNSAPSVDRAQVAAQPASGGAALTPRQQRNFGYGGYGYAGYDRRPIYNQHCDH